jgi:serine/threonine-protein kinase HipA
MIVVFMYPQNKVEAMPVGQYDYDPQMNVGRFFYYPEYLALKSSLAIDPVNLPLNRNIHQINKNECLGGVLRDSVPDLWGRLILEKFYNFPVGSLNPEQLLLYSDASRSGNLDFRSSVDDGEKILETPAVEELDVLLEALAQIENDKKLTRHLRMLLGFKLSNFSMGGARPKCLIKAWDELWLAKFPSKHDQWDNARVEMATMSLAHFCGIDVPEMKVIDSRRGGILLLKRFDRQPMEHGLARHGYLSALSVIGHAETQTYLHSYQTYVGNLRRIFFQSWTREMGQELFKRVAFNIFCCNVDDHARNHAILLKGPNMEISPAFDITPTRRNPGLDENFNLAMEFGPYGRAATLDNLLRGAPHFGLDRTRAAEIVGGMAEKIASWPKFFDLAGVSDEDREKFSVTFDSRFREQALT